MPIRGYDIAHLRRTVKSLMTDLCDIYTPVLSKSSGGDGLKTFVILPGGFNVPCFFQNMTLRPSSLELYDQHNIITEVVKAYYGFDAPITPGCRVMSKRNKEMYNVRGLLDDLSPHKDNLPNIDNVITAIDNNFGNTVGGVYKVFILAKIQ